MNEGKDKIQIDHFKFYFFLNMFKYFHINNCNLFNEMERKIINLIQNKNGTSIILFNWTICKNIIHYSQKILINIKQIN